MRVAGIWTALATLLLLVSQAAANTKEQDRMLQQALTSATGVLDLDEHQYDQLLAAPRDFSVTVLYTATSPQYKCTACHMFKDSYNQVARGWQKRKDKRHVFAMVDAHRALNVLRRVPVIYNFPAAPKKSAPEPIEYDVARQGYGADDFAQAVSSSLHIPVKPSKPWVTKPVLLQGGFALVVIAVSALALPHVDFRNGARAVAMLLSLATIFTFTSGYMFIQIRKPPFMTQDAAGESRIFGEGFQSQNGAESPVLISLYAVITLSVLVLNNVAPTIRSGPLQLVAVLGGLAGLLMGFSFLMDAFRQKRCVHATNQSLVPLPSLFVEQ